MVDRLSKLNAKTRKSSFPRDDGILGSCLGILGCKDTPHFYVRGTNLAEIK